MELLLLGGANEVGRSSFLLKIGGLNVLIDAGLQFIDEIEEGDEQAAVKYVKNALPLLGKIDELDYVLITHVHLDHIGALPIVMREFPNVKTYCTRGTQDLADVMLRNQTSVIHRYSNIHPYEYEDMEAALNSLEGIEFGEEINLSDSVAIRFIPAGHILGAAMIMVKGEGRTLVFSGNVSSEDQRTIPSFDADAVDFKTDVLVIEGTYGDRVRLGRREEEKRLASDLKRKLEQGGVVLFPCFALGRWQEVLHFLLDLQEGSEIPKCPIFLDGMGDKILSVYQAHGILKEESNRVRNLQRLVEKDGKEIIDTERRYIGSRGPAIIVAPSGSLKGGRSLVYASRIADNTCNGIFFTGFQFEGSPGHALMRTEKGENFTFRLQGKNGDMEKIEVAVRCEINLYPGFSAHADQGGLVDIVSAFGARQNVITHGDPRALSELAEKLQEKGFSTHIPNNGDTLIIE